MPTLVFVTLLPPACHNVNRFVASFCAVVIIPSSYRDGGANLKVTIYYLRTFNSV